MAVTGFVILAHRHLNRTAQLAAELARNGGVVVVHVDKSCPVSEFQAFQRSIAGNRSIRQCRRHACTWGTFSLVRATLDAVTALLEVWPGASHVTLLSGDTIPLAPVREITGFLDRNTGTDFIESVPAGDGNWTKGGLEIERFRYWFPLPWRSQRRRFDRLVRLQRRLRVSRAMPSGLTPHVGSQWWCLSTPTLRAILNDPQRGDIEQFFRWTWIPDESFFQTLVRKHSRKIESQPFVWSEFDADGLSRVFYDDHLAYLRGRNAFFARKLWPGAEGLYQHFLGPQKLPGAQVRSKAVTATDAGPQPVSRPGLVMQGRFPADVLVCGPARSDGFEVIIGFDELVPDFQSWLGGHCAAVVHGRLFGPHGARFADGGDPTRGGLSGGPRLRDRDPQQFLRNLLWAGRNQRQVFLFDAADNPAVALFLARNTWANIHILRQGWVTRLFDSGAPPEDTAETALRAQAGENLFLRTIVSNGASPRVTQWQLAEFLNDPSAVLRLLLERVGRAPVPSTLELPDLTRLAGLADYAHGLRNCGVPVAGSPAGPADDSDDGFSAVG